MPLAAGVEDTLHLNDKIYGFCSKECKDEFANKLKAEKKIKKLYKYLAVIPVIFKFIFSCYYNKVIV